MTTEIYPPVRDAIIRDGMLQEDPAAEHAGSGRVLDETGNPIQDEKGRVVHDDQ